jgi:serine/threonine protein kinase
LIFVPLLLFPQKPDNIGFAVEGTVKLFDFGLAKELKKHDRTDDDLYKLTGMTGALRYMAPEVGLGMPYNLSADVYSFSMVLWFILALEPPFGFYTEDMIMDRVFKRGSRPAVFDSWPESIGDLMKRSWSADIAGRPSFAEISSTLKLELVSNDTTATSCSLSAAGSESGF